MTVSFGANFPTITVELGLATVASGTGLWDLTVWNTATWGPDIVWTDVSLYTRAITTNRGRSRETDRYSGSATVVFNNRDARFTPANLSSPYVNSGVSQIRPRLPLRISATWSSTLYRVFYGFVDDWQDDFPGQGYDATTTASCSDALSVLAAFNGTEQTEQGEAEFAGPRVQRVLSNAGWILPTAVAYGVKTLQATTLADNALTELYLTADSDGGTFWAETDGSFVYDDGSAPWLTGREKTTQVTFGPGVGEVPFHEPALSMGADLLKTMVSYARAGGTAQLEYDSNARALYGDRQLTRTDLICMTDTEVSTLAKVDLAKYKDPEYRPVQAVCDGAYSPTLMWPHLLGRRIRDRVVVKAAIAVSGNTVTRNSLIEGVSHDIRPQQWTTTFTFSSATVYDGFTPTVWDVGKWDSAIWFY